MIKKVMFITGFLLILLFSLSILFYTGIFWFNNPDKKSFPIRGIDISSHQGKIDWNQLKSESIDFIIIKATEGKDFKDKMFLTNRMNALSNHYIIGTYHFFSFVSSGYDQATNFISTVPKTSNMLAPIIDLEFGGNSKKIPSKVNLLKELRVFIQEIENYYHIKPIIYLTYESYENYIQGANIDSPIWIRDIFLYPRLKDHKNWVLWQYSNRGRLKGIQTYVDRDVFYGDEQAFKQYLIQE